ncbi:hypothetical protein JW968_05775 [Candidatus Woesearchaeota archaeon]|nr:hypothetical protein [Candidatus Woesearchaeota archaeon]
MLVTEKENEIGLGGFLHDLIVNAGTGASTAIPIGYAPVQIQTGETPLRRYAFSAAYTAHAVLAHASKKAMPVTIIYQSADLYPRSATVKEPEEEFHKNPEKSTEPMILRDVRAENASEFAGLCIEIISGLQMYVN